ncbi:hypothetical protein PHLGIDRAFT_131352 [Phlebiopsis gigantea 11061_1 CR5-6]|uniref:AB hydrolase-1 domain-containing protein n=1 Tax=Phlebiopsis gigantea (strain 11061_1 CR5-6) TaxID=745531 RepID=A0A0C3RYC2_PHLG1|nr:hypothetical protein PHLGIDRAFT_131352 [Phlebiopsis gigantea 11061_1 CR5-6]
MRLPATRLCLLGGLATVAFAADFNPPNNLAGYNTSRVGPSNANCNRQSYQISASSDNIVFKGVDSNANQTVNTALFQTFATSMANFTEAHEEKNKNRVSNTFTLSGTLCTPKNSAKHSSYVQMLVHGVGFDSSYWDFSPDGGDTYSYVSAAAGEGYTTFRYDRLGTGLSDHPQDAYNIVQSPTDLAIATQFAAMLRSAQIGGTNFTKVIGIGHSYGSVQMQALTATAPQLLDGVILQGYSVNSTGQLPFLTGGAYQTATAVAPNRFNASEMSNAYVINATPQANQFDFFYFPYFSDAALNRSFITEQPATLGVLFSQTAIQQPANDFTGPVHVVTGAQDFPFCDRDCYAVPADGKYKNVPAYVQEMYPKTRNFSVYIPENTGHGVNAHYSAPETYKEMLSFVEYVFSS